MCDLALQETGRRILKAATIIYFFSTLVVFLQYLNGSNNIYLTSICIAATVTLPITSILLMKNDKDQIVPWVFIILFQISFVATIMSTELPSAMTIYYPVSVLLILYRNRKLITFNIVLSAISMGLYLIKNIHNSNIKEIIILILIIGFFMTVMAYMNKHLRKLNNSVEEKINEIEENKRHLEKMINDLKAVSEEVKSNSGELKLVVNAFGESIKNIIVDLTKETSESADSVAELVKETLEEDVLVNETSNALRKIEEIIYVVKEEAENVSEKIDDVLKCSSDIQSSISTLDSISAEMLNLSENSMEGSMENIEKIQVLERITDTINLKMQELDKYFN